MNEILYEDGVILRRMIYGLANAIRRRSAYYQITHHITLIISQQTLI